MKLCRVIKRNFEIVFTFFLYKKILNYTQYTINTLIILILSKSLHSFRNTSFNRPIPDTGRPEPFDKIPYKSREVSRHETIALQASGGGYK